MAILHIETSTKVCSVAVTNGESIVFERSDFQGMNHAKLLSPFVQEALSTIRAKSLNLDAVAVSKGPGSYTGLRIGVSTAKGLCYGFDIPLIAISTLEVLAQSALAQYPVDANQLLCPMIDARRMEVYTAFYNWKLKKISDIEAKIIDAGSFQDKLSSHSILFFGDGAEKCRSVIAHPNAQFIQNINPLASKMMTLANQKFNDKDFEDTAYFEPFYLKEFQATTPKKRI